MGAHSRAPDPGLEIRDWKSPQEGPASEGSGRRTGRELGWRAIVRELSAFGVAGHRDGVGRENAGRC